MERTYNFGGLDCPHCALKLETHINSLPQVKKAHLNFTNKTLKVSYKDKEFTCADLEKIALDKLNEEITFSIREEHASFKSKIITKDIIFNIVKIFITTILLCIDYFWLSKLTTKGAFDGYWYLMFFTYLLAYLIIAYEYLFKMIKSIIKWKNVFSDATLMSVASLGAFAIQEFPEAILVLVFATLGEILEDISINKSRNIIVDTIDSRTKYVSKVVDDKQKTIEATDVKLDDVLVLKLGESLPVDARVIEGSGDVDTSSFSGEFIPVTVKEGDEVLSGSILKSGSIKVKATSTYYDSTTQKILEMVMESSENKSRAETFINKFAKIYTPVVLVLALVVAIFPPAIMNIIQGSFNGAVWIDFLYRALTFLVIACPCAVVISVPLTYFIGVTIASKKGIIVKGSNYLDLINDVNMLISDKTGTITTGEFSILEEHPHDITNEEFKEYFYVSELRSLHPIATAIKKAYLDENIRDLIENYEDLPGFGVKLTYKGKSLLAGNIDLMVKENVNVEEVKTHGIAIYLAVDNEYKGYIVLDDTIKSDAKYMVEELSKRKVKTMLLSGGSDDSVKYTANKLGIDSYKSELKPEDKLTYLKEEIKNARPKYVSFLGDGVNDAPSIMLSDVGIAMGSKGSDLSKANADIIVMNDDLSKVVELTKVAKATRNRAIFCIVFSLLIKLLVMVLASLKLVDMYVAVLADSGLTAVLVLFSILFVYKK